MKPFNVYSINSSKLTYVLHSAVVFSLGRVISLILLLISAGISDFRWTWSPVVKRNMRFNHFRLSHVTDVVLQVLKSIISTEVTTTLGLCCLVKEMSFTKFPFFDGISIFDNEDKYIPISKSGVDKNCMRVKYECWVLGAIVC